MVQNLALALQQAFAHVTPPKKFLAQDTCITSGTNVLAISPVPEENKPPYPGNNILSSASTTPISVDQSHFQGYGDR